MSAFNCTRSVSSTTLFLVMRNRVFHETPSADRALARIAELLPATWSLTTRTAHSPGLDTVAELTGPTGTAVKFAVEAKSAATPSRILLAALRDLGQRSGMPVIFVSEYISRSLREQLIAQGIGYADATGWVHIALDEPLLLLTGQGAAKAPRSRSSSAVTRLNGVAASRLIRVLASTDLPIGVRELAITAQVSPGSASKLLTTLTTERVVERDDAGKVVAVHRRDLIRRWVRDYSFATSNRTVAYFIAPRGLTRALDRVRESRGVTLTGSAAARRLLPHGMTPVVPMTLLSLYASAPAELARSIGLIEADPTSANVIIAMPQDNRVLASDGVDVAPAPLVVADLLTLPGRSDAEAEQLMDALALTDPGWGDTDGSRP